MRLGDIDKMDFYTTQHRSSNTGSWSQDMRDTDMLILGKSEVHSLSTCSAESTVMGGVDSDRGSAGTADPSLLTAATTVLEGHLSPSCCSSSSSSTMGAAASSCASLKPEAPLIHDAVPHPGHPTTPPLCVTSTAPAAIMGGSSDAPMTTYPDLGLLLEASRNCCLPPSRTEPVPGTPNYPTIMLALSSSLPPRMQRPSSWCLADYTVLEKLYKGYASNVFKAVCKASSEVVVLKVYTLASVCDLYKFQIYREVFLHSGLQHENIITMHAAFQEGDKVIMVQEYADGADLFTVLQKYGGRLSERLAVQLVMDPFIRVLHYLHSRGVIHRDIKPENILFTKNMVLKLGDFGLAIDLREERAVTRAGTLDYMAPEVLRCPFKSRPDENKENERLRYGGRVDSWAVGVLTYELLVGYPPFYDQNRAGTEDLILNSTPIIPPGISDDAAGFITASLAKSVNQRMTIYDMLHHAWIEGYRSRRSLGHISNVSAVGTSQQQQWQSSLPPVVANIGMSTSCPQMKRPAMSIASPSPLSTTGSLVKKQQLQPHPFVSSQTADVGHLSGEAPFSVEVILNAMSDDGRGYPSQGFSSAMSMPLLNQQTHQSYPTATRSSLQVPSSYVLQDGSNGNQLKASPNTWNRGTSEEIGRFGIMPFEAATACAAAAWAALVPSLQLMARK